MEHEFFIPLLLIPCSLAAGECLQEGLKKVFGVKIARMYPPFENYNAWVAKLVTTKVTKV